MFRFQETLPDRVERLTMQPAYDNTSLEQTDARIARIWEILEREDLDPAVERQLSRYLTVLELRAARLAMRDWVQYCPLLWRLPQL